MANRICRVAIAVSISVLSRFLQSPAWSAEALTVMRQERFNAQVAAEVAEVHIHKRDQRSRRAGRSSKTVATDFLIMDDSTHVKRYACDMLPHFRKHQTTPPAIRL